MKVPLSVLAKTTVKILFSTDSFYFFFHRFKFSTSSKSDHRNCFSCNIRLKKRWNEDNRIWIFLIVSKYWSSEPPGILPNFQLLRLKNESIDCYALDSNHPILSLYDEPNEIYIIVIFRKDFIQLLTWSYVSCVPYPDRVFFTWH